MDSLKKKFLDISVIGVTDIVTAVIAMAFWLYIASVLGPEGYGEIAYLVSIATIASGLSLFGSNYTLLVASAKKINIQSTIYVVSLISGTASSMIVFVFFMDAGVSVAVLGYLVLMMVTADLLGKKLYKKYSVYVLMQKILMVVLGIGLYLVMGDVGILLGVGLSHMPAVIEIAREFRRTRINFGLLREKRAIITSNFAISISSTVEGSLDKLVIAPLLGFVVVGNYSLGMQFFALLTMFPYIAMKYLIPHDAGGTPNRRIKKVVLLASIAFAVLGSTLGPQAAVMVFPEFDMAGEIIAIISWAVIPFTANQVFFFSRFWASEENRKIVASSATTVLVQITGILLLGPAYGTVGIALALLLAMICGLACSILVDRYR